MTQTNQLSHNDRVGQFKNLDEHGTWEAVIEQCHASEGQTHELE